MFALLLGAGFSKWAVNLPVTSDLFDFSIGTWERENRKLEIVRTLKRYWDMTHPNGNAEQFIAPSLESQQAEKEAILWYITRRLSEPFIWSEFHAQRMRRHVLMFDERRKFDIPGIKKAREFIHLFYGHLAGIITPNYDTLVEYSLGAKEFNYGVPNQTLTGRGPYPVSSWRNPITLKGKIPLAKIHGSISWDENAYYTNGRRGLTGHALIMAPTPEKKVPESLRSVWTLAGRILRSADYLVTFGFAFNPYDEAVLELLRNYGAHLKSVLLINPSSKTEEAKKLWPGSVITSCQPPPQGNKEINNWIIKAVAGNLFGFERC